MVGWDWLLVLLLHGFPESHLMWHAVAPQLAADHTVVAPDLRGYGESGIPAAGSEAYSCLAPWPHDQVPLMAQLGHRRFGVAGHGRGGRVAPAALDHPNAAAGRGPEHRAHTHLYARRTSAFATAYYHWFFTIGPSRCRSG